MSAAKMHAGEPDITADLVRRLLAGQFPHWADLAVTPVASAGTVNAMFRLGDDVAVRMPRIENADLDVEERWLPFLAPHLPVDVPTPVAKGHPGQGYPWQWSVVRWIPGTNPTAPAELGLDLAEFLTALRAVDPAGGPPQARGMPLRARDTATRTAITQLDDLADELAGGPVDIAAVTEIWSEAVALPEWSGPSAWSHGDLSPGNVLVTDGRLRAVIDFGMVGVGDPTVDLIVAWNLLSASDRARFRAALDVDDDTWLRGRAWALSIALIQLPYYHRTNPVLAANARHVIHEVVHSRGTSAGVFAEPNTRDISMA
ncbi:hypothetical protein GCM10029964_094840 [Kibdelosporangium lantanae]